MIIRRKTHINGAKTILSIYLLASILSFFYIITTESWNGDYIGREYLIGVKLVIVVLLLTILPSIYVYWIFLKYEKKDNYIHYANYDINIFRSITWTLLSLQLCLLVSGYGVMGTDGTQVSMNPLSIFKALLIKTNPRIWGITYILISDNKKNILITSILFILNSIAAHSLGGLFLLLVALLYKYRFVYPFIKQYKILSVIILISIPTIITGAYNFRGQLRGFGNMAETKNSEIFFGKLCGRISGISNNGYILENFPLLVADRDNVPDFFYLYDPLHFFGFRPDFKSTGAYVDQKLKRTNNPNSSTMAGPLGALVISLAKSPWIFLLNLSYIVISIPLLFYILLKMRIKNFAGIGLILCMNFSQNGDSSEIANNIYVFLFMWFILNLIRHK